MFTAIFIAACIDHALSADEKNKIYQMNKENPNG